MWLIYIKDGIKVRVQLKVLSMVEGSLYGVDLNDEYVDLSGITNFTVRYVWINIIHIIIYVCTYSTSVTRIRITIIKIITHRIFNWI